jgi:hypothetical protein
MPGPMYLYIDIETAPSHDPALVWRHARGNVAAGWR